MLDLYDLKKFSMWLWKNGYADADIYAEEAVEEYLKEMQK